MATKLIKTKEIGGYKLPADFQCLTNDLLYSLIDLSFVDRIEKLYNHVTNKILHKNVFESLKTATMPASVVSVDDGFSVLELFDGNTANYQDYFFGLEDKEMAIILLSTKINPPSWFSSRACST